MGIPENRFAEAARDGESMVWCSRNSLHAWGTESRGDRPEDPGLGVFHALSYINLLTPHRVPGDPVRWHGILQELGHSVRVNQER